MHCFIFGFVYLLVWTADESDGVIQFELLCSISSLLVDELLIESRNGSKRDLCFGRDEKDFIKASEIDLHMKRLSVKSYNISE